jgi:uncharacterized protein
MSFNFTHRFDAPRFCTQVRAADAVFQSDDLPRVAQSCESVGSITATLAGALDAELGPVLSLSVRGRVSLRCERCMKTFDFPIESSSEFIVAKTDDEAERISRYVDEKYDVLVASEVESALQFVEDEILLAVPFSPRCNDDCQLAQD